MGDFTQPQQKYAGTGENCYIAIAVIFYSVIKTLWKLLCLLFGFCHTQILNLRAKFNFANMLEIIQKSGKLRVWPDFRPILTYFQNRFLTLNLISECGNTQIICTKIFIKFLWQDSKWQRLQNQQKHILQQKNVVAGKNLPYVLWFWMIDFS